MSDAGLQRMGEGSEGVRRGDYWAVVCLVVATLPWWMAVGFPFIAMDDGAYIAKNTHVMGGVTWEGIKWAFGAHAGFWIPLTWVSLMGDVTVFGRQAWGFHLTNVVLHVANGVLVYGVLRRMTGSVGRSLMAALLFAVHPLRVESVAWATERKDVLALFFGLWALWFYAGYARRGGVGRYLGVVGFYGLSLMAKPMLVSLPVVMGLLDVWPLERWRVGRVGRVVWEKVPLVVMAGVVSAVAYGIQLGTSAGAYEAVKPLGERLANGVVSYVLYLRDMVYFGGLAIFYPWEHRTPMGEWVAAGVVMVGVSAGVIWWGWRGGKGRAVMVGWFWFVVGLLPMVGVVQSGNQSRADRFTYFASIGLMMGVVWAWPARWSARVGVMRMRVMMGAVAGVVMVCMVMQLMLWRDPLGLYLDTLARTRDNWFVVETVAEEYQKRGDWERAIFYYREVVRVAPYMHEAENNLGGVLLKTGRLEEGLEHLRRAHELAPENAVYAANYERIRAVVEGRGGGGK